MVQFNFNSAQSLLDAQNASRAAWAKIESRLLVQVKSYKEAVHLARCAGEDATVEVCEARCLAATGCVAFTFVKKSTTSRAHMLAQESCARRLAQQLLHQRRPEEIEHIVRGQDQTLPHSVVMAASGRPPKPASTSELMAIWHRRPTPPPLRDVNVVACQQIAAGLKMINQNNPFKVAAQPLPPHAQCSAKRCSADTGLCHCSPPWPYAPSPSVRGDGAGPAFRFRTRPTNFIR